MREPEMFHIVCKITPNAQKAKDLKEKIEDEYRVDLILDNLPLVVPIKRTDDSRTVYQLGVHVGVKGKYSGTKHVGHFIYKHLSFLVKYHKDEQLDVSRIVRFEVTPFSVKHEYEGQWKGSKTCLSTCDPHAKKTVVSSDNPLEVEEKDIIFTYDVEFEVKK